MPRLIVLNHNYLGLLLTIYRFRMGLVLALGHINQRILLVLKIWRIRIQPPIKHLLTWKVVVLSSRISVTLVLKLWQGMRLLYLLLLMILLHHHLLLLLLKHKIVCILSLSVLSPLLLHLFFGFGSCLSPSILHLRLLFAKRQSVKGVEHGPLCRRFAQLFHDWWSLDLGWWRLRFLDRFDILLRRWWRRLLLLLWLLFLGLRLLWYYLLDLFLVKVVRRWLAVRARTIAIVSHGHCYQLLISMEFFFDLLGR